MGSRAVWGLMRRGYRSVSTLGVEGSSASSARMLVAHVQVSEGRDLDVLSDLVKAAEREEGSGAGGLSPRVLDSYVSESANKASYTLGGPVEGLGGGVLRMCREALDRVEWNQSRGGASHPRTGVVDVVTVHPVPGCRRSAGMEDAVAVARKVAHGLAHGGKGKLQVPAYLFGEASPTRRDLSAIRKSLGFFKRGYLGFGWCGTTGKRAVPALTPDGWAPDEAPGLPGPGGAYPIHSALGVALVGALPFSMYLNIPLCTNDYAIAQGICKAAGERGGGLRGVNALALPGPDGVLEVSCILRDPTGEEGGATPPDVEAFVAQLALDAGLRPGPRPAYFAGERGPGALTDALRIAFPEHDGALPLGGGGPDAHHGEEQISHAP